MMETTYLTIETCQYANNMSLAMRIARDIFVGQKYMPLSPSSLAVPEDAPLAFKGASSTFSIDTAEEDSESVSYSLSISRLEVERHIPLEGFDLFNLSHIHALTEVVFKFDFGSLPLDTQYGDYRVLFSDDGAHIERSLPKELVDFCGVAGLDLSSVELADAISTLMHKGFILGPVDHAHKVCDTRKINDVEGDASWALYDDGLLSGDILACTHEFSATEVECLFTDKDEMVGSWLMNARCIFVKDLARAYRDRAMDSTCIGFYIEDLLDDVGDPRREDGYALNLHMFTFDGDVFPLIHQSEDGTVTPESMDLKLHTVQLRKSESIQGALASVLLGPSVKGCGMSGLLAGASLLKPGKHLVSALKTLGRV